MNIREATQALMDSISGDTEPGSVVAWKMTGANVIHFEVVPEKDGDHDVRFVARIEQA